jgi:hypothetical protein
MAATLSACSLIEPYTQRNVADVVRVSVDDLAHCPELYEGSRVEMIGTVASSSMEVGANGYFKMALSMQSLETRTRITYSGLVKHSAAREMNSLQSLYHSRIFRFIGSVKNGRFALEKIIKPGDDIDVAGATLNNS